MQLLMQTHSSSEHSDGCEYAVVEITPARARYYLAKRKLFRQTHARDKGRERAPSPLFRMQFWDRAAFYYDAAIVEDVAESACKVLGDVSSDGWARLSVRDAAALDKIEDARTECDLLEVTLDGVCWTAIQKHTDVRIMTPEIPWRVFETVLRRKTA